MDVGPGTPATDGRVARGQRNRAALVEAFLDLVATGHQRVTGQQVADAAGVSARTFWSHFADLEALYDAAAGELWQRHRAVQVPVPADVPLEERVERLCDQRAAANEEIAPFARTAALGEPFSPALRASRARFVEAVRADLTRLFGADLAAEPATEARRLHALLAATTYPAWAVLREDQHLDPTAAREALGATVRSLLGLPPA